MWAGLLRPGGKLPSLVLTLALTHGPLMVSGFMGTLINLERVIAMNHKWMYAAPAMTGLGVLGTPMTIARCFIRTGRCCMSRL